MRKDLLKIFLLIVFLSTLSGKVFSQDFKVKKKSGMVIGIETGKNQFLNIGFRKQWKIKPKNSVWERLKGDARPTVLLSATGVANYNPFSNTLGYSAQFLRRRGNLNLSYGLSLDYGTDFRLHQFGAGPIICFKIWGIELFNGYRFFIDNKEIALNNLYIGARFFISNNKKD